MDDDNIVEMEVEGINNEFPSPSKDELEEGQYSAEESQASNNNATVSNPVTPSQGHRYGNGINKNVA